MAIDSRLLLILTSFATLLSGNGALVATVDGARVGSGGDESLAATDGGFWEAIVSSQSQEHRDRHLGAAPGPDACMLGESLLLLGVIDKGERMHHIFFKLLPHAVKMYTLYLTQSPPNISLLSRLGRQLSILSRQEQCTQLHRPRYQIYFRSRY